jgi:hypothetical protein
MFLHVQSIQTLRMDNPYFFQKLIFSTKCAPFLLKIREEGTCKLRWSISIEITFFTNPYKILKNDSNENGFYLKKWYYPNI